MNKHRIVLMLSAGAGVLAAASALEISPIFSDNMILQRGKPVPVWGTAAPGEKVDVTFAGRSVSGIADVHGDWLVTLDPLPASAEPRDLRVIGSKELCLTNVLVGDVWLVAGQSNAEMTMASVLHAEREMATATDYPTIRATKFAHRRAVRPAKDPCNGAWRVCTPETVRNVTAIGWFFAREIVRETGVPIGILDNNWGGCAIEPYVSREGWASVSNWLPAVHRTVEEQCAAWTRPGTKKQRFDESLGELEAWLDYATARRAAGKPIEYYPYRVPGETHYCGQYNAMIAPITRFPIAGIAWYQGCSNADDATAVYGAKLHALVNGWRRAWGADTPFYIVQLSTWKERTDDPAGGNGFANVRESQRLVSQSIPHSGLVVTIDVGCNKKFSWGYTIHPPNKLDPALRLSRLALRDVYGRKQLVAEGPMAVSAKTEGDAIRVTFRSCGRGLMLAEKDEAKPGVAPVETPGAGLKGFAIAGTDRKWAWAEGRIDGRSVILSAPGVKAPVAVRYAFRMNPSGNCNLYNREGLPAAPFRTDRW